ncbi:imidazole glycerol phosphate synthase subunit HisH [Rhodocyclus tenuis]|uniref:Imidazole glycerol phosphate synthase subunit HisH n=1 Tax=Rhodocyclus gracilis TaxID=2929842 RepID=A0ABX0WIR0_9RHOO|nr:imidazole glycerol phosphate synthase subunit HisH [Rhodocyclus gracilis]MRD72304.1 imidazole glycerol phosphate synthase subunit HisH [Rhodocyclus gracilis]NJA89607.1 imidazole glycerol phosphate synthase subunit HisH [Rhodocyclus gracilis]
MITILNYGMGNLGSLVNMFRRLGIKVRVESSLSAIEAAEKLILPGVGAFDAAMRCIDETPGLRDVLNIKAQEEKVPILGVCLGMQLLTGGSEEGARRGLNWIPGRALRFPSCPELKVPHMGWNSVNVNFSNPLTEGFDQDSRFYFVHSYYVQVESKNSSLMTTVYGREFSSAIVKDNVFGVQFHPEKSHRHGMRLLKNFAEL